MVIMMTTHDNANDDTYHVIETDDINNGSTTNVHDDNDSDSGNDDNDENDNGNDDNVDDTNDNDDDKYDTDDHSDDNNNDNTSERARCYSDLK